MKYIGDKKIIDIIIESCKKHNITAYEIKKHTGLNVSGVQKILNKEVTKPREKTINKILKYLETKEINSNTNPKEDLLNENIAIYHTKNIKNTVPYYNIEISGSSINNLEEAEEYIEFYIDYKPLNNCTAYLPYFGDSMFPKFKSGNTLAIKEIQNFDVILWGEAHLIITNDNANNYKTVKCIHQHENTNKIILRAINPEYKGDITINKSDILSLFIVKGKIELTDL